MSEQFAVRPAELRGVAAECATFEADLSSDVVAEHLAPATGMVPGSLIAEAMRTADAKIALALASIAGEVRAFAENVTAAADGYEETDDAFARALQKFDE